jgi:hypothetical protein
VVRLRAYLHRYRSQRRGRALQFPPLPAVQRPGSYSVEILLDGRHLKSLPFTVAHPPPEFLQQ